jgi:hypothetical protein
LGTQTKLLELLDVHGAGLHALLTRLTLREEVAEELMQELFLKLHAAKDQGRIECWYAYARRTAINLAFDWRRRQAIRRACSLDALSERASETDGPLGKLIASEELEQILAAVGRLRGPAREVFARVSGPNGSSGKRQRARETCQNREMVKRYRKVPGSHQRSNRRDSPEAKRVRTDRRAAKLETAAL